MFPWINKFLLKGNNFLRSLIKKESYSSHCIFQTAFTLNKRCIKAHRRSTIYAINQTVILSSTLIGYKHMFEMYDWTKRFDKYPQTQMSK